MHGGGGKGVGLPRKASPVSDFERAATKATSRTFVPGIPAASISDRRRMC